MTRASRYDVCVIGAGLIGLAVARAVISSRPGAAVLVIEKEDGVAVHQSGHNSGVVHSGLYYKPGSLKARLCVEGRRDLISFAEEFSVPHRQGGKLVIATKPSQIPALDELERRGVANGLSGMRRLVPEEIKDFEPAAVGVAALHVPEAGVTDFPMLARALAADLRHSGAEIVLGAPVESMAVGTTETSIASLDQVFRARLVVNCAGLHSDRVAAMAGVRTDIRIIPFRGEYYTLTGESSRLTRSMIYPVPDPRFPFLGVHFTRGIDDEVEVGPNAVLALGREHYRDASPVWADVREALGSPGFRRLAYRHLWTGASETLRSRSRVLYARSARSLVPEVRGHDLVVGGAGVRAQAVSKDGRLIDDFVIEEAGSTVHVLNAPSPGATSSLAIGRYIAALIGRHLSR